MSDRGVIVVGAGPGVSGSLARLLAREGYAVGLVGVDTEVLETLSAEVLEAGGTAEWVVADVTDAPAATEAIAGLGQRLGRVDLLHFNPSAFTGKNPMELTADELLADVALGVGGLLTAVQAARRFMGPGSRVTVTGSMAADQPSPGAASLGVQKAGVRNLVRSLDATLEPDGIRAVTVTVRGSLAKTGPFTPDRVAEALIAASRQREDDWRVEVPYDGPVSV
jgi:NAD(P)-dependent dehydrogenase (short-subunit alcohol dehydrogenase family)